MTHADALAAITNPTVNSYKRINAPRTLSGATWSPNTITYTGNNRTHMIRIPDAGRFELRLADGSANLRRTRASSYIKRNTRTGTRTAPPPNGSGRPRRLLTMRYPPLPSPGTPSPGIPAGSRPGAMRLRARPMIP